MTLIAGQVVHGTRATAGWLEIAGGAIAAGGAGRPPRAPDLVHDGLIARGLVDLQLNGAAGGAVTGGHDALDRIDALLLRRGVTSYLATIPTTDDGTLQRAARDVAERAADPSSPVAGLHLEGPFLSPAHAGVHPRELLRSPQDGLPAAYTSPALRMVTLAPELPGALALIAELRRRGVAVAIGHTACDAAVARRALDAGARLVTHLFNAMAPLHHRRPGPVGVALADRRCSLGLIADGVHVDPLVLDVVRRAAGSRVVLVSDATPAAGAAPGTYDQAGVPVTVDEQGRAVSPSGVLAGSTITLDEAVRRWRSFTRATLAEAAAAASSRPARPAGLGPSPSPGAPADLVLLDADGRVVRTMRRGQWVA
jgi:N-acetylglucosamine-6-phosphate deacetylase